MLTFLYPLIVPRERKEGGGICFSSSDIVYKQVYKYISGNVLWNVYCISWFVNHHIPSLCYTKIVVQLLTIIFLAIYLSILYYLVYFSSSSSIYLYLSLSIYLVPVNPSNILLFVLFVLYHVSFIGNRNNFRNFFILFYLLQYLQSQS